MKNLMIYINPRKEFDNEEKVSFRLGWKKEDIILITNFPYKYQGVLNQQC